MGKPRIGPPPIFADAAAQARADWDDPPGAQISFFCSDGGKDCFSLAALSLSGMISVYRYVLHRILNLVDVPFFLIFTDFASLRLAICRNCLISVICFGIAGWRVRTGRGERP